MEKIVKDIDRFWSEAMQTLKEVVEKGAREVVDLPACECGLPLPDVTCSQHEKAMAVAMTGFTDKKGLCVFCLLTFAN